MLFGKYINKYYKKYWYLFVVSIIALIFIDYCQLYVPEFVGQIVDFFSGNKIDYEIADQEVILNIIIKVLLVAIAMFLGRILYRYTLFYASRNMEAGLRDEMFLKASRLQTSFYHENKLGGIMSIFTNDLETIEEFIGWGTVQLVDAIFITVIAVYKMFMLDWALTIVALIPAVLIIIWGFFVEKVFSRKWEIRQKEYDKVYDFAQENFTGIRVIKAFVQENAQIFAFSKAAKKTKDANIDFVRTDALFQSILSLIIALITSLILGFGSYIVYSCVTNNPIIIFNQKVTLTSGNLITFVGYFDTLVYPLIAIGGIFTQRSRAKTSLGRVINFLDTPETIINPTNPLKLDNPKGEIEFTNFNFTYPSSEVGALKDINLKINAGEKIGVVGKIGCGKSTLVNILLRLYNVDKNTVKIDGKDIMDLDIKNLRENISYVPQDNFLFSCKIEDNIKFADSSLSREEVINASKFASIHNDIDSFPENYDTVIGERGVTLSGGQKQRISIARAFIRNSSILILDDSVSACDLNTEETILNNIYTQRENKTTILIASRISTVSKLDRIIVLNEGKVEAFDTHENLLKISPTYQKMDYLQKLEKEVGQND